MSAPSDPAAPASLTELLRRHAARSPHRPWLFWPEGLDWPWASFAAVAAEVERLRRGVAAGLAARRVDPPAAVAYPSAPRPGRVCLDLALQAAGYTAWPVAEGSWADAAAEAAAWVVPAGEGEGSEERGGHHAGALPLVVDAPWLPRAARREDEVLAEVLAEVPRPGGAVAVGCAWTAAELVAGAGEIAAALGGTGAATGPGVVVSAGPLDDPGERRLLAWALATAAAVVLEPVAGRRAATAAWARPTVFKGSAADLEALRREAEVDDRSGLRGVLSRLRRGRPVTPPFGRLAALLVEGPAGPGAEWWRRRGVRVVELDAMGVPACDRIGR